MTSLHSEDKEMCLSNICQRGIITSLDASVNLNNKQMKLIKILLRVLPDPLNRCIMSSIQ